MENEKLLLKLGKEGQGCVVKKECVVLVAKADEVKVTFKPKKKSGSSDATEDDSTDSPQTEECKGVEKTEMPTSTTFNKYDIVRIHDNEDYVKAMQEEYGLVWENMMRYALDSRGLVQICLSNGAVHVECISTLKFTFSPYVLTKIDEPNFNADVGDLVWIPGNATYVKDIQDPLGIWNENMRQSLEKAGMVREVLDGNVVSVEVMTHKTKDPIWMFHSSIIPVIATREEMLQARERRKVGEQIEESENIDRGIEMSRLEVQTSSDNEVKNSQEGAENTDGASNDSEHDKPASVTADDIVVSCNSPVDDHYGNPPADSMISALTTSELTIDTPLFEMSQLSLSPRQKYSTCHLQIRLSNGEKLRKRFEATDCLQDVFTAISESEQETRNSFHLMSPATRQIFKLTDADKSLTDLGLVPSSVLIVTATEHDE